MKQNLIEFYLDWVNHFISVGVMSEHYGITLSECVYLINAGRKYHEQNVELLKLKP